jgi:hypothetical protein
MLSISTASIDRKQKVCESAALTCFFLSPPGQTPTITEWTTHMCRLHMVFSLICPLVMIFLKLVKCRTIRYQNMITHNAHKYLYALPIEAVFTIWPSMDMLWGRLWKQFSLCVRLVVLSRTSIGEHQGTDDARDKETHEDGMRDLEEKAFGPRGSECHGWQLMGKLFPRALLKLTVLLADGWWFGFLVATYVTLSVLLPVWLCCNPVKF